LQTQGLTWPQISTLILEKHRTAQIKRETKETCVEEFLNLDQSMPPEITTGLGFFDHMLEQLSKHSGIAMQIRMSGDLHIDEHHTVEDTALALGQALKKACGDKWAMNRFGSFVPMDEAS